MEFSDYDLVSAAQKGDKEAFGKLYDLYYKKILGFAVRRTGSVQIASDVTQNTFLKVLQKVKSFVYQDIPFSAWVYRIAVNEITDYHRQKKSYSLETLMEEYGFEVSDPKNLEEEYELAQEALERKKSYMKVLQALKSLQPVYQDVLSLRFFEKKKTREIGDILGKSEGTVKSLLSRGIAKLKKEMEVETA